MVITPNGLRVLEHIGVLDQVRSQGFGHESVSLLNIKDGLIKQIMLGSEELFGYPAIRLYRNTLRRILLEDALKRGVEIKFGARCISVENETADSSTVVFENDDSVTADLVIGTDGMNSRIREHICPDQLPMYSGQVAVIAFAEKTSIPDPDVMQTAAMIIDREGSFAMIPADGLGDQLMFFSTIQIQERTREQWHDLNGLKQELKHMLQNPFSTEKWPLTVRKLVTDTPEDTFFCWPFYTLPSLKHFVSPLGRTIVAGDSAHAIPPSAGVGESMCLEDAETLACTIGQIVHMQGTTSDAQASLLRWERHRKERIERVLERTRMGSNIRKTTKDEAEQIKKEKETQDRTTEDDLEWLYKYDGRVFVFGKQEG